jgi:hypothetical protein
MCPTFTLEPVFHERLCRLIKDADKGADRSDKKTRKRLSLYFVCTACPDCPGFAFCP